MICSIEDCDKTVQARGFCQSHYDRWRHNGKQFDPSTWGRPSPLLVDRIRDILETDGGWLTTEGVVAALPDEYKPESVYRTLHRLRTQGEAEVRETLLARSGNSRRVGGGDWGLDARKEWRFL